MWQVVPDNAAYAVQSCSCTLFVPCRGSKNTSYAGSGVKFLYGFLGDGHGVCNTYVQIYKKKDNIWNPVDNRKEQ